MKESEIREKIQKVLLKLKDVVDIDYTGDVDDYVLESYELSKDEFIHSIPPKFKDNFEDKSHMVYTGYGDLGGEEVIINTVMDKDEYKCIVIQDSESGKPLQYIDGIN